MSTMDSLWTLEIRLVGIRYLMVLNSGRNYIKSWVPKIEKQ